MRGFTAVEMLLTAAVLGILALAAVVLFPSSGAVYLKAAAEQVGSDIAYAQQNAMSTGQVSGVQFVSGGSYTVYQGTVGTPLTNPLTKETFVVSLGSTYPGVSIAGNYTVEFDAMGKPTLGGGGSVTLSKGNSTKTVSVTANTGRVVIQ
jgi:prepilin-type N-terminal cleavage/methylation domain-containing protein